MTTYRRPSKPAMQGRHKDGPGQLGGKKYSCSTHGVTYLSFTPAPLCPVCDAEEQLRITQEAMQKIRNEVKLLHEQNKRLRAQTDVTEAIREALGIIGQEDLLWLKEVLYQWKIDRSVSLKVTHGKVAPGRSSRKAPNGFIAMYRGRDPEGYLCKSVGGLAVAEYLEEGINTVGSAQAMILLVRAFAKELPGAST